VGRGPLGAAGCQRNPDRRRCDRRAVGTPELGAAVLDQAVRTAMVDALLGPTNRSFSDHIRAAVEVVAAEADLGARRLADAVARFKPHPSVCAYALLS
jgi:hypothetical protein